MQPFIAFVTENSSWLVPTAFVILFCCLLFTGLIRKLWTVLVIAAIIGGIFFLTRPEQIDDLSEAVNTNIDEAIDPFKDNDYAGILDR